MNTNDLRKYIKSQLDTVAPTFYQDASDQAMYPHLVYDFKDIDLGDYYRQDYILIVDVWHKNSQADAEDMSDALCELLSVKNAPQQTILPTFYRESRKNILDEDKDINHIQLRFQVQVYDNE